MGGADVRVCHGGDGFLVAIMSTSSSGSSCERIMITYVPEEEEDDVVVVVVVERSLPFRSSNHIHRQGRKKPDFSRPMSSLLGFFFSLSTTIIRDILAGGALTLIVNAIKIHERAMPLRAEAHTLFGGCNCRAVRYRINIPHRSQRPYHPRSNPSAFASTDPRHELDPVVLPYTFTDHCNDCRRATASILPTWITAHIDTVEASSINVDASTQEWELTRQGSDEYRSAYRPARETFTGTGGAAVFPPLSKSTPEPAQVSKLNFYQSSPGVMRGYCSLCGTNVSYWMVSSPNIIDILYGTIDRDCLEDESMRPERHMWWEAGIGWVKSWVDAFDAKGERHMRDGEGEGGLEERVGPGDTTPRPD